MPRKTPERETPIRAEEELKGAAPVRIMWAVKYIGDEPGRVRLGTRPVMPGDTISGPPDVLEELSTRADFEKVDGAEPIEPQNTTLDTENK
jgi:hypothetical protein